MTMSGSWLFAGDAGPVKLVPSTYHRCFRYENMIQDLYCMETLIVKKTSWPVGRSDFNK